METILYVSVIGTGGAKSHDAAERAFIERAQRMGYQPVRFGGDAAETSEFSHVNTHGPVRATSSVAWDRAISRMKSENAQPFMARAVNVQRIADVLRTLDAEFPGICVNVVSR